MEKERKGLRIVGVYVANEGVEDLAVPRTVGFVADRLRVEFEETIILVVRPRSLQSRYRTEVDWYAVGGQPETQHG